MIEDKYYTPKIEEFHVGFEYEYRYKSSSPNTSFSINGNKIDYTTWSEWINHILTPGDLTPGFDGETSDQDPFNINTGINQELRVKYLDIEDCVSLGWDRSMDEPDEWCWSHKGDMDIQLYFDDKTRALLQGVGVTIFANESMPAFSGRVKNKSELKRLMEQLGI